MNKSFMENNIIIEKLIVEIWDIIAPEMHNFDIPYSFCENERYNELIESKTYQEMLWVILANFPSSTSVDVIFCTPYLWKDLRMVDVNEILINLLHNKKGEGLYALCWFFHRYWELDLVSVIKDLNIEDKLKTDFIQDEAVLRDNLRNFGGIVERTKTLNNKHENLFQNVRERLLKEGFNSVGKPLKINNSKISVWRKLLQILKGLTATGIMYFNIINNE